MPSGSHKAFVVAAFELIDGKIVIPNVGLLVNAYVAHTKSQKGVMMKGSDLEHYDLNLLAQHGSRDVKVINIPKGHAAFTFEEDQKPYVGGSYTSVFVLELAKCN